MKINLKFHQSLVSLIAGGILWVSEPLFADYSIIDLGTLGEIDESVATAINNLGHVVGYSEAGGAYHAFLWKEGKMIDLGTLGGFYSEAVAINDRDQVIGQSTTSNDEVHAFLWEKGNMIDLGLLRKKDRSSWAVAINKRGLIVGNSGSDETHTYHGFLWKNRKMIGLGGAIPSDINDQGQIVGASNLHAFLWKNGKIIDLGTLRADNTSRAIAINNRGQVIGISRSTSPTSTAHSFLWKEGKMIDLRRALAGC